VKKRHLLIILIVNAVALAVLSKQRPTSTREVLGLYAMANIAEKHQVVLPESFSKYPDVVKIDEGKYMAPQPLWQQIGGAVSYRIAKVFFKADQNWEGMRRFFWIASYLANLIASTVLLIIFAKALEVKSLGFRESMYMFIPLCFFSLILVAAMTLEVYLFVAALCFWAFHLINSGVYLINRDMPFRLTFMMAGVLLAFAGCLNLPAIGIGLGFLAMFITQKDGKFNKAALDIVLGAIAPIALTVIITAIYSKQAGAFVTPWPGVASATGTSAGVALKYFYYSTIGMNGFFIYSPLALIGVISLVKRLNHFQRLMERGKRMDHYARGQALIAWSVYWGGIITLVLFWLDTLMNGVPVNFNPDHLKLVAFKLGGEEIGLASYLRTYGTMQLLFLLPLLHYFNLHIFKEKPFLSFKPYYHEVVRFGGLFTLVGLASANGGYIVPFIWSLNQIAMTVTHNYPIGTLLW
jgi:hypothetical protein